MSFVAVVNSSNLAQIAYDTMVITDASEWDTYTTSDFTSRKVTITDKNGDTPAGFDAEINFPLNDGFGDELEIVFPTDMAITLVLTYVPVIADGDSSFISTITTIFSGNTKAIHSSRVTKSEISGTLKPASVPQYIATTSRLTDLIDSAEYEASVGNLESAQDQLDKASLFDSDLITY